MRKVWTIALVGVLLFGGSMAYATEGPEGNKTVSRTNINKGWSVSVHVGEVSNVFSHCVVRTTYEADTSHRRKLMRASEMVLFLKALANGVLEFEIASLEWKLTQDKHYNIKLDFDKQWFKAIGIGQQINGPDGSGASFVVPVGEENIDQFIVNFATSRHVEIFVNESGMGVYPLQGSAEAAQALLKGVTQQTSASGQESSGGGRDTFDTEMVVDPSTRDTFR